MINWNKTNELDVTCTYIYIYIYIERERERDRQADRQRQTDRDMKNKQGIQRMILYAVQSFANINVFVFTLNRGQDNVSKSCIFRILFNFKVERKKEESLSFLLLLVNFQDKNM